MKVTYIEHDGAVHVVEATEGFSVMETARDNGIPGIEADCGGACACATCHVFVDRSWSPLVGPPHADEAEMLEFANDPDETSRLSCQIKLVPELDGLIVRLPQSQR